MANVYTIIDASLDRKNNILSEDDKIVELETALLRVGTDINHIYSPLYHSALYTGPKEALSSSDKTNKLNVPGPALIKYRPTDRFPKISAEGALVPIIKNESKGELLFMSANHHRVLEDAKESSFTWVYYRLGNSPKVNDDARSKLGPYALYRVSRASHPYESDLPHFDESKMFLLLDHIKELKFEFWNEGRKAFVDSIRLLNKESRTPRLIRLTITWISENGSEIQIFRSFRPLWPYFDTEADEAEKYREEKSAPTGAAGNLDYPGHSENSGDQIGSDPDDE